MSCVWEIFAKVCICVITKIAAEVTLSLRFRDPGQYKVGSCGLPYLGSVFLQSPEGRNRLPFLYYLYILPFLQTKAKAGGLQI